MGGEGAMMAANNSLKNNRGLLAKRKEMKALEGSYANIQLKEFPKATVEQLEEIRERIQTKNKQNRIRLLIVLGVSLIILVSFVIYLNHWKL
jgi:maltodextrin utilization protein YvdJ